MEDSAALTSMLDTRDMSASICAVIFVVEGGNSFVGL